MENLYQNYPYALYFICAFFIILQNHNKKSNISSNIIIIYLLFSLTNIFGIMNFIYNTIIILLLSFVELEILDITDRSDDLFIKSRYKFLDFTFKMVVKYKFIYMFILNSLMCLSSFIYEWSHFIGVSFVLLCGYEWFKIVTKIYRNEFKMKSIDEFDSILKNRTKGYSRTWKYGQDFFDKVAILTRIEDKSFFYRVNTFTFIGLDTLLYKISRENNEKLESKNFNDYIL